jgi:hypothetical protein
MRRVELSAFIHENTERAGELITGTYMAGSSCAVAVQFQIASARSLIISSRACQKLNVPNSEQNTCGN